MKRIIVLLLMLGLIAVSPSDAANKKMKILTNHIGYDTHSFKHAVILGFAGDNIKSFWVEEAKTGQIIFSGSPQKIGPVHKWKDWIFWTIDFNAVTAEGEYVISCETNRGPLSSFPFLIQDNILERHTLSNVIFYFKGQRCSGLLDKADRTMTFLDGRSDTVDVHGGWYDASGDYGKHLSHLSFSTYFNPQQIPLTVWSLLKTCEALERRNDENFNQIIRRLLDEARHGADYLVRIKASNSSFFRTVSGRGPGKLPEDRRITPTMKNFSIKQKRPIEDEFRAKKQRIVAVQGQQTYVVGYRAGAGLSIAALALAGSHDASGDFTSVDYLQAAEDAFAFLEEHNIAFTNDGKENIVDDYCALLASVELYKTTGKAIYKNAADQRAENLMNRLVSSGGAAHYWRADDSDRPFFHASDAGLPVVSLLAYLDISDKENQQRIRETVKKAMTFELQVTDEVANPFGYARQLTQNKTGLRRTRFFYPHDTETAPWWQGENARLSSLAAAARLTALHWGSDTSFCDSLKAYARNQLNWILGLNPFDACMLHGSGRNNPEYMFFGTYQYTNAPGGICNGITAGLEDEDDIDFNLLYETTGKDYDWRWGEQWLPHASWYILAVSLGE